LCCEDEGHAGIFEDEWCKDGQIRPNPSDDAHLAAGLHCDRLEVAHTATPLAPQKQGASGQVDAASTAKELRDTL